MLSRDVLERDPSTAHVNESACAGCFECLAVCPYGAIERKELLDAQGEVERVVAAPNPAMLEPLATNTCAGSTPCRSAIAERSSVAARSGYRCQSIRDTT